MSENTKLTALVTAEQSGTYTARQGAACAAAEPGAGCRQACEPPGEPGGFVLVE